MKNAISLILFLFILFQQLWKPTSFSFHLLSETPCSPWETLVSSAGFSIFLRLMLGQFTLTITRPFCSTSQGGTVSEGRVSNYYNLWALHLYFAHPHEPKYMQYKHRKGVNIGRNLRDEDRKNLRLWQTLIYYWGPFPLLTTLMQISKQTLVKHVYFLTSVMLRVLISTGV